MATQVITACTMYLLLQALTMVHWRRYFVCY